MLSISEFDYHLPSERIAVFPHSPRDHSKLLHFENGIIKDRFFYDLPELLPSGSFLIFNESKVIRARLIARDEEGKRFEFFCLEPADGFSVEQGLSALSKVKWKVMIGGRKKLKENVLSIRFPYKEREEILSIVIVSHHSSFSEVEFSWKEDLTFSEVLEACGKIPLPPYLNREEFETDEMDYQTTYAKQEGSVAAPTAGLHFTDKTFLDLDSKGIKTGKLVLHVGAGTFKPVKEEDVSLHEMHEEEIVVSKRLLEDLVLQEGKIGAVGTTSLRSLESLFWLGEKMREDFEESDLKVEQWDYKKWDEVDSRLNNLNRVLKFMQVNKITELRFKSGILIAPPYEFKMVDFLITNFHQPKSTLILLIAAFVGKDWRKIYDHALENEYRFLSFGDSSLLMKS